MRVSKKGGVSVGTVAILEGGRTGYFPDTYGPAVYDIYFESAKGGAEGLVEASTRSFVSGAQILDVGTGTGNVAFEAARRFADASVIGVDIAEQALELARHKAAEYSLGNVEFRQGDALALSFEDNTFDVVLANQVVGGPTTQRKMLSEMLRVVRPNGAIAVAKSNPAETKSCTGSMTWPWRWPTGTPWSCRGPTTIRGGILSPSTRCSRTWASARSQQKG